MHNKKILEKIIEKKKSLNIEEYINLCLYDKEGYYIQNKPIGRRGDFITAPEISQLFGELIGLFIYSFWNENINKKFNFIELGPGKGTLLIDIINITKLFKNFQELTNIKLIEKNIELIKIQKHNIKKNGLSFINIKWLNDFNIKNKLPTIILANEFFDCLPIRQFHKKNNQIFEKKIIYDEISKNIKHVEKLILNKKLLLKINKYPFDNILEISKERDKYFDKICKHIKIHGGMMILIDYGYYERPNHLTLQSLYNNKKSNILDNIGKQDITSLVDFKRMIDLTKKNKLNIDLFCSQRDFLINHGIYKRADKINKNSSAQQKKDLLDGLLRLTDDKSMGSIFKVLVISK